MANIVVDVTRAGRRYEVFDGENTYVGYCGDTITTMMDTGVVRVTEPDGSVVCVPYPIELPTDLSVDLIEWVNARIAQNGQRDTARRKLLGADEPAVLG